MNKKSEGCYSTFLTQNCGLSWEVNQALKATNIECQYGGTSKVHKSQLIARQSQVKKLALTSQIFMKPILPHQCLMACHQHKLCVSWPFPTKKQKTQGDSHRVKIHIFSSFLLVIANSILSIFVWFSFKRKKKLNFRYKEVRNVAKTGQLGTLWGGGGPILLISIANLAN
jgi:hypothetical protein